MALLKPIEAARSFVAGGSNVRFADKIAVRKPPLFIDDYPGLGFTNLGIHIPRKIQLEEPYCLHAQNVRIIGYRHIVTADGHTLNDRFVPREQFLNEVRQAEGNYEDTDFLVEGDAVRSERIERVQHEINEPVIMLNSHEPSNYGSWLFRILPKLITADNYHLPDVKFFVYARSPWQFNLLEFAGVHADRVLYHNVTQVYQAAELYVPALRNAQAYLDHESVRFYRQLVADAGIQQKPERLIYVSRRQAAIKRPHVRLFINEAEFIAELEKLGFDIVEPENLTLREQVQKFASAKVILGPSGSGMFNVVFAPKEALFISIEAFSYWLHAHSNLPASMGLDYAFIVGQPDLSDPAPIHKRWSLDVPKAIERIRQVVRNS